MSHKSQAASLKFQDARERFSGDAGNFRFFTFGFLKKARFDATVAKIKYSEGKMNQPESRKDTSSAAAQTKPEAETAIAGINYKTSGFPKEPLLRIEGDTPVPDFKEFWQTQYSAARAWK